MSNLALSIKNLKKTYDNGVQALKGVDLEVQKGDFFALLGPNGAGKSTTIGIITDLVNKSSGDVKIFGKDIDNDKEEAKAFIGVVPQEFNFNIFEKVIDIIVQQACYYGIPSNIAKQRAEKYLKKLELWEKRNEASRTLSGGQKRRLMIARAMVHEPELLILDEPTAGVDIEIRRGMWKFLKELNKEGKTIILTTHYFEEAEYLCKNIGIIDKGTLVENTSMKDLLRKLDKETYVIEFKEPVKETKECTGCTFKKRDENTIEVEIMKTDSVNTLFKHFEKYGMQVESIRPKNSRLEDLFVGLLKNGKN